MTAGIGNRPPGYRSDGSLDPADKKMTDRILIALGDRHGIATTRDLVADLGIEKLVLEVILERMRTAGLLKYELIGTGMEWRRSYRGIEATPERGNWGDRIPSRR